MSIRSLGYAAIAVALPAVAWAVPWGASAVTVRVSATASVSRVSAPCPFSALGRGENAGCFAWRGDGVTLPPASLTQRVHLFAVGPRARLVAVTDEGALYTDDLGATWRAARWEGPQTPRSVTFDDGADDAWAVGSSGTVWRSTDRGLSWRVRADVGARTLVDVAAVGGAVVVVDDRGEVRASTDRGEHFRGLDERCDEAPTLSIGVGAVTVRACGRAWRVSAASGVERL